MGSEEYEISIPLTFKVENEDYSYGWHYSFSDILENLVSVDWSLKGTWTATGGEYWADNYRYEYDIFLEIGEIANSFIPNDNEEQVFSFDIVSDSIYINDFYGENIYSCVTSSNGLGVVFLDNSPGVYEVDVMDEDSELKDMYEIYMGVYDDDEYKCGVYWTGGGGIVQLTRAE